MLPITRSRGLLVAAAATAAIAATPAASLAESTLEMTSSISPNRGPIGSPINLGISFKIDPVTPGELDTISRVVVLFPPNARHNGKFFPSCSAALINARKSIKACPKGSQIGIGGGRADVSATDVYGAPYTLTFFNGSRSGNKVTLHVRALRPVDISEAFEATLVKTSGRYGYRLTFNLPDSLQEISPGWFAQVRTLRSSIRAFAKVRGRRIPYIQSTTLCPKTNFVPIESQYWFRDGSTVTQTARIACRR